MKEKFEHLFSLLDSVLPGRVFYGTNQNENHDDTYEPFPFIVYQEISRFTSEYGDDESLVQKSTIQISLINSTKSIELEKQMEEALAQKGFNYNLITEFISEGCIINRIYEIKMEVIK